MLCRVILCLFVFGITSNIVKAVPCALTVGQPQAGTWHSSVNIYSEGTATPGAVVSIYIQNTMVQASASNGTWTSTLFVEPFTKYGPINVVYVASRAGYTDTTVVRTIGINPGTSFGEAVHISSRQKKEIYVATNGNNNNPGTISQPLLTLAKARDVAKGFYDASQAPGGVTIYMRSGWYYHDSPVEFTSANSGLAGGPLIIKSYPGEIAYIHGALMWSGTGTDKGSWSDVTINTISGTKTVKKFTFSGALKTSLISKINQIKATSNNGKFALTQCFVNSTRRTRARHPNGWGNVDLSPMVNNCSYVNAEVKVPTSTFGGLRNILSTTYGAGKPVEIVFTQIYQSPHILVTHYVDLGTELLLKLFVDLPNSEIQPCLWGSERCYIANDLYLLDEAGEFFIDESTTAPALYSIPNTGDNLTTAAFSLPVNDTVLLLKGTSDSAPIHDIWIDGISVQMTNWSYCNSKGTKEWYCFGQAAYGLIGAIEGNYLNRIVIQHCYLHHYGANGITFGGSRGLYGQSQNGSSQNIAIYDNDFVDGGGGAVRIDNLARAETNNRIIYNTIYTMGQVFHDICPINVWGSSNSYINHNYVEDAPYSGMNICAYKRYSANDYHQVAYNTINLTMRTLRDGGGIYSSGSHGVIQNNLITNTATYRFPNTPPASPTSGYQDVFLDSYSTFWDVKNNTCPLITHWSVTHRFSNNSYNGQASTVVDKAPGPADCADNVPYGWDGLPSGYNSPSWW